MSSSQIVKGQNFTRERSVADIKSKHFLIHVSSLLNYPNALMSVENKFQKSLDHARKPHDKRRWLWFGSKLNTTNTLAHSNSSTENLDRFWRTAPSTSWSCLSNSKRQAKKKHPYASVQHSWLMHE